MRCANCGAENRDGTIYCGSCATQLVEFESQLPGTGKDAVDIGDATHAQHDAELRRSFRNRGLKIILLDGLLAVLASQPAIQAMSRHDPIAWLFLLIPVTVITSGAYFVYVSYRTIARSFFRLRGYEGEVLAEASANGVAAVAVVAGVATFVAALALYLLGTPGTDSPDLVIVLLASLLIAAVLGVSIARTKAAVTIERGGILYGSRQAPYRSFIPMDRITSMKVAGSWLRVSLAGDSVYSLGPRRFFLMGDTDRFVSVVERLAPAGEMLPPQVVTPGQYAQPVQLLRSRTDSTHQMVARTLAGAGGVAAMTGAVFLIMADGITKQFGPGSVPDIIPCCGTLEFVFAAIILLGAFFAFRKKRADLVSAASWVSILSLGGVIFGPALGILALVLLKRGRDEFE